MKDIESAFIGPVVPCQDRWAVEINPVDGAKDDGSLTEKHAAFGVGAKVMRESLDVWTQVDGLLAYRQGSSAIPLADVPDWRKGC